MKSITPIPEILTVLATELGAGRSVLVPGLGTFKSVHEPASVDSNDGVVTVEPPRTSVGFVPDSKSPHSE